MSRTQELIDTAKYNGKGTLLKRIKEHLCCLRIIREDLRVAGFKDDSLERDIRLLSAALRRRT